MSSSSPGNPSSSRISVLSPLVIDQIAAGEVVERPASVVKELVDNAIDAGPSRVDVVLEEGGLGLIAVRDNGRGIHPDDLILAVTRHATSKLRDSSELAEIATLGFRGEALASISAVARLDLRSRTADAAIGTHLHVRPGEPPRLAPVGMPVGTQVEVHGLFATVPARRKFMRAEATEIGQCSESVLRLAIVHPDVHLTLHHGKRELLNLPRGSLDDRVAQVLGRRCNGPLFGFSGEEDDTRVQVWLPPPEAAARGRGGCYVVVRRRVVRDRSIAQIVAQAYGLSGDASACIFIDPPRTSVDVNVHPQKSEVRFSDPQRVYSAVRRVLAAAMAAAPWAGTTVAVPAAPAPEPPPAWPSPEPPSVAALATPKPPPEPTIPDLPEPETSRASPPVSAMQPNKLSRRHRRPPGTVEHLAPELTLEQVASKYDELGILPDDEWEQQKGDANARAKAAALSGRDGGSPSKPGAAGYRLNTRAMRPGYEVHKRDVMDRAAALAAITDKARAPTSPPPPVEVASTPTADAAPELFAADILRDEQPLEAEPEPRASVTPATAASSTPDLPQLLTCLPGLVAIFSDRSSLLAVDLRRLRAHLVYLRLQRDLVGRHMVAIQGLLTPVVVARSAEDIRLLITAQTELQTLGIDLDRFGEDAVVVRGVPAHLRHCIDNADITDLIARIIPWLRIRTRSNDRTRHGLLGAIASTQGGDPAPRLARKWLAELLEVDATLADVPGVRRWTAAALLADGMSQRLLGQA